jgi:hypothetical protein
MEFALPGVIHCGCNTILMRRIDFFRAMGFTAIKMDAEMAIEFVI